VAARLLQVVVFPYRGCSFTAVTPVQIPSGTPNLINTLHEIWRAFPWDGMYSEQRIVDSRGPLEPNVGAGTDPIRLDHRILIPSYGPFGCSSPHRTGDVS
jgi:hypothetical protein